MKRRELSPVGRQRQRIGRKVLASSRMAVSLERRGIDATPVVASKRSRRIGMPTFSFR